MSDFSMLNPFPLLRDEDGEYHCPMGAMVRSNFEDDDAPRTKALCGEILQVHWRIITPIPDLDGDQRRILDSDASAWALYSSWQLRCHSGHVIATSEDGYSEDCQPFDPAHWWGLSTAQSGRQP